MPNLNNIFPKEILVYLLKTNKNAYLTCILDILFNIKSIYIFIYIRPYICICIYQAKSLNANTLINLFV